MAADQKNERGAGGLEPLPVDRWDASLSGVVDDMGGRPLNVHRLMANNPALLAAWWSLRNHSVRGGELSPRQRELVILRVAVHMRCWYEWASHVERGLAAGLSAGEIERVKTGADARDWAADEALVIRVVDELVIERGVSANTRAGMEGLLSSGQLLDLMAIVGMYQTLGTMINTWGLELDDFIELPDGVVEDGWLAGF